MRFGAKPDGLVERAALAANLVPTPILDTQIAYSLARTVMVAAKLGVFEALAPGPMSAVELAHTCDLNEVGAEKLLNALAGARYVHARTNGTFELDEGIARWVDPGRKTSVHDKLLSQLEFEWDLMQGYEEFVRSGTSVDMHDNLDRESWSAYQRGMKALARVSVKEFALRTSVPKNAQTMLDIGGSHGLYSVELCRRHKGLTSTILDLPEAVETAAPLLAEEHMGQRVVHRPGNALTDDLGTEVFDVILLSQLAHHFTAQQNIELTQRVYDALRPGGVFIIQDVVKPAGPADLKKLGLGALMDLYFAVTSRSGTWTVDEMQSWQQMAGFDTTPAIWFATMGSTMAQLVGTRP